MHPIILKFTISLATALFALATSCLAADESELNSKTEGNTPGGSAPVATGSAGSTLPPPTSGNMSNLGDFMSRPTRLQGVALPTNDAELRSTVVGIVQTVHVRDGDWVEAGDALVTFDDRIARANVAVARQAASSTAALKQAELEATRTRTQLMRTEQAYASGASSDFEVAAKRNQWQQAQAVYEGQREAIDEAVANLAVAEAELAQLTLTAPFAGQVVEVRAKVGNTLDTETVAVRVADLTQLRVEMFLPLDLYGKIETQATYELMGSKPFQQAIPARAIYVSQVVEPTSATFRVLLEIENANQMLPSGIELWFGK